MIRPSRSTSASWEPGQQESLLLSLPGSRIFDGGTPGERRPGIRRGAPDAGRDRCRRAGLLPGEGDSHPHVRRVNDLVGRDRVAAGCHRLRATGLGPNSGWPFSRTELDPYYDQAFRLFDVDPEKPTRPSTNSRKRRSVGPRPPTLDGHRSISPHQPGTARSSPIASPTRAMSHLPVLDGNRIAAERGRRAHRRAHGALPGGNQSASSPARTSSPAWHRECPIAHDVQRRSEGGHRQPARSRRPVLPRASARPSVAIWCRRTPKRWRNRRWSSRHAAVLPTRTDREVQQKEELLNFIVNLSFGYAGQETPQFEAVRRIVNANRSPWSDSPYYQDTGGGPNRVRMGGRDHVHQAPGSHRPKPGGRRIRPPKMRRWLQVNCQRRAVATIRQSNRPDRRTRQVRHSQRRDLEWTLRRCGREDVPAWDGARPWRHSRDVRPRESPIGRYGRPDPWPDEAIGTWHHAGTTRMDADRTLGVSSTPTAESMASRIYS